MGDGDDTRALLTQYDLLKSCPLRIKQRLYIYRVGSDIAPTSIGYKWSIKSQVCGVRNSRCYGWRAAE